MKCNEVVSISLLLLTHLEKIWLNEQECYFTMFCRTINLEQHGWLSNLFKKLETSYRCHYI